jgi:phospholipid/cholesterol/gamma-HCH transport system ATP-binding protein
VDSLILDTRDRTGATCVVVSHDIAAVLSIADQVSLIHDGRMILTGTPGDFRASRIPAVREFISGGGASGDPGGRGVRAMADPAGDGMQEQGF